MTTNRNLDIHSGLTLTGRCILQMGDVQYDWEEDAPMNRLYGPLDAPTFAAAGGMWQAIQDGEPVAIQCVTLLDRRIA